MYIRLRSVSAPYPYQFRLPKKTVSTSASVYYPLRTESDKKKWIRIWKRQYPHRSDPFSSLLPNHPFIISSDKSNSGYSTYPYLEVRI